MKDKLKTETNKKKQIKKLVEEKKNHQTCDEDHKCSEKIISL